MKVVVSRRVFEYLLESEFFSCIAIILDRVIGDCFFDVELVTHLKNNEEVQCDVRRRGYSSRIMTVMNFSMFDVNCV